jgi:hypothetical protein
MRRGKMPKKKRKQRGGEGRLTKRSTLSRDDKPVPIEQFVAEHRDQEELSEDEAFELAWEMHPDLNRMRLKDTLPEEMVDGEGNVWSPRMHIDMHVIVERQLANNDPDGIADRAIKYEREGKLDSHEIRHMLAAAVSEQVWYMSKEGRPFSSERYFDDIERSYERFVQAKQ